MKPIAPFFACLAAGLVASHSSPARSDTLLIQRATVAQTQDLPRRGASMASVESRYGAPRAKHSPVGGGGPKTPPITRWDYETFSVYFENSHVVDAVLAKASPNEIGPAPVTP